MADDWSWQPYWKFFKLGYKEQLFNSSFKRIKSIISSIEGSCPYKIKTSVDKRLHVAWAVEGNINDISKTIVFNSREKISEWMIWHELGHIHDKVVSNRLFDRDSSLFNHINGDWKSRNAQLTWRAASEYIAHKWAIDKAIALKRWDVLKGLLYCMIFIPKNGYSDENYYRIAFDRLEQLPYIERLVKEYCHPQVYRMRGSWWKMCQ